ncbi:MAG: ABC transporter substrate-binding protein [Actinomycetes bacterium]
MRRSLLSAVPLVALLLAACGSSATSDPGSSSPAPASSAASSPSADPCAPASLATVTAGKLTIGTDKPAYPPYFVDDTPSNGKGFESAVAYAVAKQLGYTNDAVTWTVVPFNNSYAPGKKSFDFDINQISITPERAKVVTFSDGYYTVNQAVVSLTTSKIAGAKTLAELQAAKLGAQVGTTSLKYIQDDIKPAAQPSVFNDSAAATAALKNGQIDGLVVDLPTAYYITAAELDNGKIVGQFPGVAGPDAEQFGMLFQKDNPLATCVNQALASLQASGDLQKIQDQWLAGVDAPYFAS